MRFRTERNLCIDCYNAYNRKRYETVKHDLPRRRQNVAWTDEDKARLDPSTCALCGKPAAEDARAHHLDHDHISGYIRDYLCNGCNIGLGAFVDSPDLLRAAAAYLERHAERINGILQG